jgi:hypothetical protein
MSQWLSASGQQRAGAALNWMIEQGKAAHNDAA